jgi:hypothetical protein
VSSVAQKITKGASNRVTSTFSLPVTATANTDFVFALPVGAQDVSFTTFTTTGYGAATDAQISIGKTAGGAEYVAATTIKAVGVKQHTRVDAAAADYVSFPGQLNVRVAQSGTASATGAASLMVSYSLPTS